MDLITILWKEWKDLPWRGGRSRRSILFTLVPIVGFFGVFWPFQIGRESPTSPVVQLMVIWVPLFLVTEMVADSVAGERERKTIETVLAALLVLDTLLIAGALARFRWARLILS